MTDTSPARVIEVPAERPVEAPTIALLRDVKEACTTVGAKFVLAGATARDILMWHLHDIKAPVATRDVDVAVCAVSWEFHGALIERLVGTKRFRRHARLQQKLLFKREADFYETELDVVPFGPIERPPGEIRWPPGGDIAMTVLGFQEAVDTAQAINIGGQLEVPVVTLPAFVLLKLFAWKDRRLNKNTDAGDLLFILRNYVDAGIIERLYANELDLLEAASFDVKLAAAGLLGREVRDIAYPGTRAAAREILQSPATRETLRRDLVARAATLLAGYTDDSDALLAAFAKAFLSDGHASTTGTGA
jgi:predicted nucleotidyltransferase